MANVTTIYACTGDGLAIFNKPGTLNEWLPPRRVLAGMPVLSVWGEPGPPAHIVAVQSGVLLFSESGGRNWEKIDTAQPAARLFIARLETQLYAALQGGGLLHSNDRGVTWKELPPLPGDAVSMMSAGDPEIETFYLVTTQSLYAGSPETGAWHELLSGRITSAGYDQSTGNLYASAESLVQSTDAGRTWTAVPGSPSDVVSLLVVPGAVGKPSALVAALPGGLWVSPDGGETWQQKELAGTVTTLARDPERRDRLYAGTSEGLIFESGNRGQTWTPVNAAPLPAVISLFVVRI